jgi:hypothetical protein
MKYWPETGGPSLIRVNKRASIPSLERVIKACKLPGGTLAAALPFRAVRSLISVNYSRVQLASIKPMIKRTDPWHARSIISKWAHVIERIGLALAGASCGLFVAAHVGRANIDLIGSATTVLAIMLYGAAGFYLGIDLPSAPPDHRMHLPLRHGLGSRADAVELLSAAGTFLAAVAAIVSVASIILGEVARPSTALLISFGWGVGASLQVAAGIVARTRAETSTTS